MKFELKKPQGRTAKFLFGCVAAGLGVAAPLMVCVVALNLVQKLTNSILGNTTTQLIGILPDSWRIGPLSADNVPFLSVVLLVSGLFVLGAIKKTRLGSRVFGWIDALVMKVPFLGGIYKAVRGVTEAIAKQSSQSKFDRVVYVDVTGHQHYQLAFVVKEVRVSFQMRKACKTLEESTGKKYLVVMTPSPPNPTGGAIRLVPAEQAFDAGMDMSEGIKVLMTYGMETPDNLCLENLAEVTEPGQ